jgi:hypothetical protein
MSGATDQVFEKKTIESVPEWIHEYCAVITGPTRIIKGDEIKAEFKPREWKA